MSFEIGQQVRCKGEKPIGKISLFTGTCAVVEYTHPFGQVTHGLYPLQSLEAVDSPLTGASSPSDVSSAPEGDPPKKKK